MTDLLGADVDNFTCNIEGCDRSPYARNMCGAHYTRYKTGTDMNAPLPKKANRFCTFPDCGRFLQAKGYCDAHYKQSVRGEMRALDVERARPLCKLDGCEVVASSLGYCIRHYRQFKSGATMTLDPKVSGWRIEDGYRVKSAKKNGKSVTLIEHREVMSKHLKRPLIKGENVHHKNGQRADNRLSNLELWSVNQPAGQRVEDKADWAIEILALYRPEALANYQPLKLVA